MKLFDRNKYGGKIYGKNDCPFCGLLDEDNVIWKGKYWFIQHNKFPYLGLENHFLVIPFSHKIMTDELTKEEFGEFTDIEKYMREKYMGKPYFSFIRQSFGKNNRSVEHLHYHYLPGKAAPHNLENMLKEQGF